MSKTAFEYLIPAAGLLATIFGAVSAFSHLAIDVKGSDLAIALAAMTAAATAGTLSVYIARIAKAVPRTQRIFISYSYDEKDRARTLSKLLQERGAKVWFDENALQPGSDLQSSIGAAIESSNTVVALVSGKIGTHLTAELRAALDRHVPVFAVLSSGAEPSDIPTRDETIRFLEGKDSLQSVANAVLMER